MLPQLICTGLAGLEVEVTVPLPSRRFDLRTVRVNVCTAKVAVTDFAAFMVTVQVVPETESQPLQPVSMEPAPGAAVKVTTVPRS